MRRRALLALLGSSLTAGCAALDSSPAQPSPSPAPGPSDSPDSTEPSPSQTPDGPDRPDQPWSLVEFETRPVTVSLTSTAGRTRDGGVVQLQFVRTATADHPAAVRGTFQNANSFANTFELQGLPLFQDVPSAWPGGRPRDDRYTYRDELLLAPTDGHDLARMVPEWTVADDGRWRLTGQIDGPWLPETIRLADGASFTFEYALVGRSEGTGFPRDRYHFEGYDERDVVFDVWTTGEPGPDASSRFAGSDPTPLPDAETMAWFHDADVSTATSLRPSTEQAELPTKVEYTFVNHSRSVVSGNPSFWRLWKRVDGQWFHVAPWGWPAPLSRLPPGGTLDWTLAAFDGPTVDCDGAHSVGHLGGGRYAFEVGIGREGVTHAALLDVESPPATIDPTGDVEVTREDTVVHVEWPHRTEEVPRATLTLARARDADARLIAEQVMQPRNAALRNTLTFVEPDVDRVVLEADRNAVSRGARTSGYEDGSFRFTFDGQAYEASATFGDGG